MKHLILLALFTFHSSLFILSASAAVPLKWTVETSRAVPAQFEAYQGETLALEAALQSYGKPLAAPSDYSLYWQTNGMGSTYWSVPCTQPNSNTLNSNNSNTLYATWSPTNDVGAKVYNCFIGQPGTIYHAAFQLRLRPSPGATPNELPLPQKVIDFAKVTVLNPPWSGGGGGGVDTNAVVDIIHRTVDGSARTTPKYLWIYDCADSYPEAAHEYYSSRGNGKTDGGCSSVRDGGFLYRNFDYPFDDRAEFVVKVSAGPNRLASVGVAQVGTNLTEAIVTSGKPSRCYKWLPGATVDGINENGVACNINVVDGDPQTSGWHTTGDLHPLGAIRHILDHATNAQHGAEYIAANIRFPSGWTQNFHYMIADETSTYIVENGSAHAITNDVPTLTNFRLYPTPSDGEGQERYDLLLGGANITNVWYTNAYRRETNPPWLSDLAEVIAYTNDIFDAWAAHPKEHFRNSSLIPHTSSLTWWQSIHTSVYDITNRTLRVAVQETDDWYVFAVDQANVDLSPIEAQIAELQDGKRDKADRAVWERDFTEWSGVPEGIELKYGLGSDDIVGWYPFDTNPESPAQCGSTKGTLSSTSLHWTKEEDIRIDFPSFTATRSRDGQLIEKSNQQLAAVATNSAAKPANGDLVKYDEENDRLVKAIAGTDYAEEATGTDRQVVRGALITDGYWDIKSSSSYESYHAYHAEEADAVNWSNVYGRPSWYDFYGLRTAYINQNPSENLWRRFKVNKLGSETGTEDLPDYLASGEWDTNTGTNRFARLGDIPPTSETIRTYDRVRQCWWVLEMVNGVPTWTVEE